MFFFPEELLKPEEPYVGDVRNYFVSYSRVSDMSRTPEFFNTIIAAPFPATIRTLRDIENRIIERECRTYPGAWNRCTIIQFTQLA